MCGEIGEKSSTHPPTHTPTHPPYRFILAHSLYVLIEPRKSCRFFLSFSSSSSSSSSSSGEPHRSSISSSSSSADRKQLERK